MRPPPLLLRPTLLDPVDSLSVRLSVNGCDCTFRVVVVVILLPLLLLLLLVVVALGDRFKGEGIREVY